MAILFSNGSTNEEFTATNSANNINFNGTSACMVVAYTNTATMIPWDRGCFQFYSNNYASIEYRFWVPSYGDTKLCYCWRTCSQDNDSYIRWNNACNHYNELPTTYARAEMATRLVCRSSPGTQMRFRIYNTSVCCNENYYLWIDTRIGFWNGWKNLQENACGGQNGKMCVLSPAACTEWSRGYITIPICTAYCWYFKGFSCEAPSMKWIPYCGIVCRRTTANGWSVQYCSFFPSDSNGFVWCTCV